MTDLICVGRTDVRVSRLGVGVMTWGDTAFMTAYGGTRGRDAEAQAFDASLVGGVNFFDTADMYGSGNSERRLGELACGKGVVIATKFAPRPPRTSASLPRALDASRARLGRTSVDLYQIHFPVSWISLAKLIERLADAAVAGTVRAVGVSNFSAEQMRLAHRVLAERGVPLASNQVQYSLLYRRPEVDGVLDTCRELGVTPIAYMPLAMGALTGKYRPGVIPQDRMRRTMTATFRDANLAAIGSVVATLREIGARHDKTPSQVALRWIIDQDAVPIPGAKNGVQATENAGALTFCLSRAEIDELAEVTRPWLQQRDWKNTPALPA